MYQNFLKYIYAISGKDKNHTFSYIFHNLKITHEVTSNFLKQIRDVLLGFNCFT